MTLVICTNLLSIQFDTYMQEDCVSWNSDQHDAHRWSRRQMVWSTFPEWDFSFYLLGFPVIHPGKWKGCILGFIFHTFVIFLKLNELFTVVISCILKLLSMFCFTRHTVMQPLWGPPDTKSHQPGCAGLSWNIGNLDPPDTKSPQSRHPIWSGLSWISHYVRHLLGIPCMPKHAWPSTF